MVGIVYGAAFSWNSDIPEKSAINADISVIEYGDRSASLVEVISHMSNQAVVNWGEFVRILENLPLSGRRKRSNCFLGEI